MNNLPITVNEELLSALCNADTTIQKVYELKNEEQNLRSQAEKNLERARKEEDSRKKTLWLTPFLPVPVAIGLVMLFVAIAGILDELFNVYLPEDVLWLTIPSSLVICLIWFIKTYHSNKHKIYYEAAKKNEYLANEKLKELEVLIENNQHYIAVIAPEFRYPVATQELLRIFRLGRATTLPEAYDKLELRLHQMKVEEKLDTMIANQRAYISLLMQIEYNTRWL